MDSKSQKVKENEHVNVNANEYVKKHEHVNGHVSENTETAKEMNLQEKMLCTYNRVSGGGEYLCVGRIGFRKTVPY